MLILKFLQRNRPCCSVFESSGSCARGGSDNHASGIGGSCGREDSTGPENYWGEALNEYYADDTLNEVLGI
jgi:hypothetical protein